MSETGTGTDVYTSLYTYDPNGSLLTKTRTGQGASSEVYEYSLRNRLIRVTVTVDSQATVTEYRYDTSGNRVLRKVGDQEYQYLVDTNNPTGYSQVVVESSVQTGGQADVVTSYIIGDDVIGQANASGTQYLGYDGHGSTRLLLKALLDGQLSQAILERYDFGAYGEAQGFIAANASTNLLWTGEWFEKNRDMYHLRFRDYNVTNAQFIQSDGDGYGNRYEPASLHKYAYTHANPINATDPTGHWSLAQILVVAGISFLLMTTVSGDSAMISRSAPRLTVGAGDDEFDGFAMGFGHTLDVKDTGLSNIHALSQKLEAYVNKHGGDAKVKYLTLYGHGIADEDVATSNPSVHIVAPGAMGPTWDNTSYLMMDGSGHIDGPTRRFFEAIAPLGAPEGWTIKLYSCNSGAGTNGRAFLQDIADITRARVIGYKGETGTISWSMNWFVSKVEVDPK